jgi:hypothetical protein
MRQKIALLAAAGAVIVLGSSAGATSLRTLDLRPGEGFYISGTELVCTYGGQAGTAGGLGCRFRSSSSALVGSYTFAFGPQELSVNKVTAPGSSEQVFTTTQPRARPAAPLDKDYFQITIVDTLGAGDVARLANTDVRCAVATAGVRCSLVRSGKLMAGQYTAAIDGTGVVVRKVVAKRIKRKGKKARIVLQQRVVLEKRHGS